MKEYKGRYELLVITGDDAMRQHEQATLPGLCGIPGERAYFSGTLEEALQVVDSEAKTGGVGVAVTDLSRGGARIGTTLLEYVKRNNFGTPVIIKSGLLTPEYSAGLIRKGAFACYDKAEPIEKLADLIKSALAQRK